MNKLEMTQILAVTKLLYGRDLSEGEVSAWFNFFRTADALKFKNAVEAACKATKFSPTPGEVQAQLDVLVLPASLRMSAAEAYAQHKTSKLLLVIDALEFARRAITAPTGQYESPEALGLAKRIYEARFEKEFKQRFENLQNQAKAKMHLGLNAKQAIASVCIESSNKEAMRIKGSRSPKVSGLVGGVCGSIGLQK